MYGDLDGFYYSPAIAQAIAGAPLLVRSFVEGRLFVILAVVAEGADRQAFMDRLADHLTDQVVRSIGGANYFSVESVARVDSRLAPGRAAVLIPA